jgi:hypothetical protein
MHSDILDEQGRVRVAVFYKAAFYDRRANARLVPRYTVAWLFPGDDLEADLAKDQRAYAVKDGGKIIWRGGAFDTGDWKTDDARGAEARAWLNEHYPHFEDPTLYW